MKRKTRRTLFLLVVLVMTISMMPLGIASAQTDSYTIEPDATVGGETLVITATGLVDGWSQFDTAVVGGSGLALAVWFYPGSTFSFNQDVTLSFQGDAVLTVRAGDVIPMTDEQNELAFSLDDGNSIILIYQESPGNFGMVPPVLSFGQFPGTITLPDDTVVRRMAPDQPPPPDPSHTVAEWIARAGLPFTATLPDLRPLEQLVADYGEPTREDGPGWTGPFVEYTDLPETGRAVRLFARDGGRVPARYEIGETLWALDYHPGIASNFLHLVLPEGPAPTGGWPVLVYSQGAAWMNQNISQTALSNPGNNLGFVERGFALAVVSYRHTGTMGQPVVDDYTTILTDLRTAVRYLRHRADEFNLNTNAITVYGISSGGHTSSMLAVTPDGGMFDNGRLNQYSGIPNAVISVNAPTTLLESLFYPTTTNRLNPDGTTGRLLGGNYPWEVQDSARAASTTYHIPNAAPGEIPPFLIMAGTMDNVMPPNQSIRQYMSLREHGHPAEYIMVIGAGHGGGGFNSCAFLDIAEEFMRRSLDLPIPAPMLIDGGQTVNLNPAAPQSLTLEALDVHARTIVPLIAILNANVNLMYDGARILPSPGTPPLGNLTGWAVNSGTRAAYNAAALNSALDAAVGVADDFILQLWIALPGGGEAQIALNIAVTEAAPEPPPALVDGPEVTLAPGLTAQLTLVVTPDDVSAGMPLINTLNDRVNFMFDNVRIMLILGPVVDGGTFAGWSTPAIERQPFGPAITADLLGPASTAAESFYLTLYIALPGATEGAVELFFDFGGAASPPPPPSLNLNASTPVTVTVAMSESDVFPVSGAALAALLNANFSIEFNGAPFVATAAPTAGFNLVEFQWLDGTWEEVTMPPGPTGGISPALTEAGAAFSADGAVEFTIRLALPGDAGRAEVTVEFTDVENLVAVMVSNAAAWSGADVAERARLANESLALGAKVSALLGRPVIRGSNGVWYVDRIGGERLFDIID
ncbi:MAG: prolyl oligopeptidase family serine peptidase [Oscillospiraceae bacterium]|nr:prolyl oligopeptidase family serine peptidase [Oscillospiraceae bacterium]